MNNVEQDLQTRAVPRWRVWLYLATLACLGMGALLLLRFPTQRKITPARAEPANADQAAEVERLKQAVSLLQQKTTVLAAAAAAPAERAAAPQDTVEEPKAAEPVKDTRSAAQIRQDNFTELDARFTAENDGSRDNLQATRTLQAELDAAPLAGTRIAEVACATSLCRTTLEHDTSASPPDMAAVIEATPSVRREAMFRYTQEGSLKRVTIYSAREGHRIDPASNDVAAVLP